MNNFNSNICDLKRNKFHNVIWLPTGECISTTNHIPTNYIQLDKRRLKAPYHDLINGFNCTLNYMNNPQNFNTYKIKSLDGKLLDVDHKYNRLSFVNDNEKIIYNMTDVILISGSYIFKCKLINAKTSELIDNEDVILISIISVFEKDSSMNFCFSNYRESNISNTYNKFVSFNENLEVNISDSPTLFSIENMVIDKSNNTLKYGEIVLTPFRHPKKNTINGTIIPIILPFKKM